MFCSWWINDRRDVQQSYLVPGVVPELTIIDCHVGMPLPIHGSSRVHEPDVDPVIQEVKSRWLVAEDEMDGGVEETVIEDYWGVVSGGVVS